MCAGYRSEWRTDLQFGNEYGIETELYRPFTATSKWFFAPRGEATDTSFKVFHRSTPQAIYRFFRDDAGIDVGYGFSRFAEIRAGYEVGYFNPDLRIGTQLFPSNNGRFGDTRLRFLTDHRDDFIAPRRGYSVQATFRWYDTNPGARDAFPVMEAQAEYFEPITKPGSLFVIAQGGTTFGSNNIGVPQFFLGRAVALERLRNERALRQSVLLFPRRLFARRSDAAAVRGKGCARDWGV